MLSREQGNDMGVKGVIVAAGYGTRFLPVTRVVPKELLPLVDRPCLDFVVQEFLDAGIEEILVITSRRKKALDDWFDHDAELEAVFAREGAAHKAAKIVPTPARITFVRQRVMGGTGHALLLAQDFAGDSPVVVAFPDDLYGEPNASKQLIDTHHATGGCVLGAIHLPDQDVSKYGVLDPIDAQPDLDGPIRIRNVVEKPPPGQAPSQLVSVGRYLYTPDFFPVLRDTAKGHGGGEFYPMDAMKVFADEGRIVGRVLHGRRHDTGTPLGYLKAVFDEAMSRDDIGPALADWLRARL
jgi:UTP--glucose-1-phosphate uridylyltransferase